MNRKHTCVVYITKNHATVVEDVLSTCLDAYYKYGIDIYYYDASDNDATMRVIEKFREAGYHNLYHVPFDSDMIPEKRIEQALCCEEIIENYDYIWISKDRSYVDAESIERILEVEKETPDLICLGLNMRDGEQVNYTDVEMFYCDWAAFVTSWDATIISSATMTKNLDGFQMSYDGDFESFAYYYHVFYELSKIENPKVITVSIHEIHNALNAQSTWTARTFDIWEDKWIRANDALPNVYQAQKNNVIKFVASMPQLLGDEIRLWELQELGVLNKNNIDHIADNWERVSDVPIEVVRDIACSSQYKKVSVLIYVNQQSVKEVLRCMDCLLTQTMEMKYLQLIFLLDGVSGESSEYVLTELERLEKQYSDSVCLIQFNPKVGCGMSYNVGLEYATGRYISFLTAYDLVDEKLYQFVYETAITNRIEEVCYYSSQMNASSLDNIPEGLLMINDDQKVKIALVSGVLDYSCTTRLYRTSVIKSIPLEIYSEEEFDECHMSVYTGMRHHKCYVVPEVLISSTDTKKHEVFCIAEWLRIQLEFYYKMVDSTNSNKFMDEINYLFLNSFYCKTICQCRLKQMQLPIAIFEYMNQVINELIPNWRDNRYLCERVVKDYMQLGLGLRNQFQLDVFVQSFKSDIII